MQVNRRTSRSWRRVCYGLSKCNPMETGMGERLSTVEELPLPKLLRACNSYNKSDRMAFFPFFLFLKTCFLPTDLLERSYLCLFQDWHITLSHTYKFRVCWGMKMLSFRASFISFWYVPLSLSPAWPWSFGCWSRDNLCITFAPQKH